MSQVAPPSLPPRLVFVVDDEPVFRKLATGILLAEGYRVEAFASAEDCLERMIEQMPAALLLDLELGGMCGSEALSHISMLDRELAVVVVSAHVSPRLIASITQRGAHDFVMKPVRRERLATAVRNALQRRDLTRQVAQLEHAEDSPATASLVGKSLRMKELRGSIRRVAGSDVSVLIQGESGSGKELVARAIHDASSRSAAPFVAINCAAIPENLEAAELFGHEKGAFTGATGERIGRIEQAQGGTLLLDEIADLSLASQSKLLRVLQERRLQRLGGSADIKVDFRLVAASHRSLREEVALGRFREDLFFRIVVFDIDVPPLRDRHGDIPLLIDHFMREMGPKLIDRPPAISPETLVVLEHYHWPGNVRELYNALQRGIVNCSGGRLLPSDLPEWLAARMPHSARDRLIPESLTAYEAPAADDRITGGMTLQEVEKLAIKLALTRHGGVMSRAASELGIARSTLYRKVREHCIKVTGSPGPPPSDKEMN